MNAYWLCKYPKNVQCYFTIYIIFNDKMTTDADIWYWLCEITALSNVWALNPNLWSNTIVAYFSFKNVILRIVLVEQSAYHVDRIAISKSPNPSTNVVSLNSTHGEMNLIQHYVIKFVSDLQHVGGFLQVLRCPPPIKLTTMIKMKYCWKWL